MSSYNAKKEWNKNFLNSSVAYPAEYVIRMFKGSYPRLNLDKASFKDAKICDVGCGDGRNLIFLARCGFDIYGVEISKEIVEKAKANLLTVGIEDAMLKEGSNTNIPFKDKYFDYLLSWNACYYMGDSRDFGSYVKEFDRVLNDGGYLILSIPKLTCFIYHGSKEIEEGYFLINNDPFGVRNGEVLRGFKSTEEIEESFSEYFENFVFASVQDDCFGFDYHWHLAVCQKKNKGSVR